MTDTEFEAAVLKFHDMIADVCCGVPNDDNCERCWLRLYCFTAPRSISHEMIHDVVRMLIGDAQTA